MEELAATLREVGHPEVVELDLSGSRHYNPSTITSVAALGAAVGGGALASLRTLNLKECDKLTSLPAELGRLSSLQTLNLSECRGLTSLPAELASLASLRILNLHDCRKLTSLPAELGSLSSLQTLNLSGCDKLTSLPAEMASLASLQTLNLAFCSALTRMPDLSGLPQLEVTTPGWGLPDHLEAWKAGGRKAGTFEPR